MYRVSRDLEVFGQPAWEWTGDNRFDDLDHRKGNPEPGLFRVVYCASSRVGAFGETIARFRKSIRLLSHLRVRNLELGSRGIKRGSLHGLRIDEDADEEHNRERGERGS